MRQVINRAGIKENLDITKIREKLIRACDGLEVNMVELESYIDSIYEKYNNKKNSRISYQSGCFYDKF